MAVLDFFDKPESDPGEWVDWRKKGDGTVVRLRIRALPPDVRLQILERHTSSERFETEVKDEKGDMQKVKVSLPTAKEWGSNVRIAREHAMFALIDSENLDTRARGEGAAKFLSRVVGKVVVADEDVLLDSHLTDEVKKKLFGSYQALVDFVVDTSNEIGKRQAAKLEELEGN